MKPFEIVAPLRKLSEHYPDPKLLLEVALEGGKDAQDAIARLWLSEGIPSVFLKCPAIYDSLRCWITERLEVKPKEIGLVGSAHLGKSLVPCKIGTPFHDIDSDLDLFIVSCSLFTKLTDDFERWASDIEHQRVNFGGTDTEIHERRHWKTNLKNNPNNLCRGFIDAHKIPASPDYPTAQKIQRTMEDLTLKLIDTEDAPKPEKASIRCYNSWDSFIQQKSINLRVLAEKLTILNIK